MIERITHLQNYVGQILTLQGWAANVRSSGSIVFVQLRDGSGFVQAVFSKEQVTTETWEAVSSLTIESSCRLTGTVSVHPKKVGVYEIQGLKLEIVGRADEFPIGKKEHGPDFLLDNRHLWLRTPSQWAIQRVRNEIIFATYTWMHEHGFTKIDSPIFTPSACEGTTDLFEVDYFGERKAYLSQSGQLYLEAAIASVGKCFDFGPVFRAEKSKTRRHLTEFWMMDAEAAFADHEENMLTQETLVIAIVDRVLKTCTQELGILERDIEPLKKVQAPFVRMTHAEAVLKLRALGSDIGDMDDLGADDETLLTKQYDRPIFVEKYPAIVKAFYMKRDPDDATRVLNADLLAPEGYGEIIGGSQREEDIVVLRERMKEHHLDEKNFLWYLDTRKYGSVPHSGFGYGLERLTAWICGLHHIRETIPFPRLINRLEP